MQKRETEPRVRTLRSRASTATSKTWRYAAALATLAIASAACGGDDDPLPPETTARIDAIVLQQMRNQSLPSVVVGVWIGDRSYVTARGMADLSAGRPRNAEDAFRIASISKTFIGTAALILVDRGLLSKADTLDKWYPAFPNASRITVENLLRMRSGIADSADAAFIAEYWANPLIDLDAEAMIARSAARAGEFIEPDTLTHYTNVNFVLLERIVEKASGTDIRSFLRANVFEPLDLRSTSYPSDSSLPGALRGYSLEGGVFVDRTVLNPLPAGGAGAVISSLENLKTYGRALCRGDLLKPATQAARLQPTPLGNEPAFVGYGEGLGRLGRFCGHNGTIFGFSSEVWYLPEKDATIVMNVNRLDRDDETKSFETFALIARELFPDLVAW